VAFRSDFGPWPSPCSGSQSYWFGDIPLGRITLDEWSARRGNLYLTTHNILKTQTSMAPEGFEPTFPASERPQTLTLDRAATAVVW